MLKLDFRLHNIDYFREVDLEEPLNKAEDTAVVANALPLRTIFVAILIVRASRSVVFTPGDIQLKGIPLPEGSGGALVVSFHLLGHDGEVAARLDKAPANSEVAHLIIVAIVMHAHVQLIL